MSWDNQTPEGRQMIATGYDMLAAEHRITAAERSKLWAVVLGLKPIWNDSDTDRWCVMWGDNLGVGVVGFGDTPEAAMLDFEKAMASAHGASEAMHNATAQESAKP